MTNKYRILLLSLPVLVALGCYFADYLPPRTPLKVAARISGFTIPPDSEILYYDEKWDGLNDGYCRVALKLTPQSYQSLRDQVPAKTYKRLTSDVLAAYHAVPVAVEPDKSIYKLGTEVEYGDYSTVILDDEQHVLVTCLDFY
ncbi:hypothetical protein [Spirosoma aerophilum]